MTRSIDFYFDFISPYSFLAYKKIKTLKDIKTIYKPILLGGLHKLGGITAPAFNQRKMKNMKNDCEIIAKKNNIEFNWNNKFPINEAVAPKPIKTNEKPKVNKTVFKIIFFCFSTISPRLSPEIYEI